MLVLYPEDPQLLRFSQRFASPTFDPTTIRPIISPRTQMKPVMPTVMTSIEEPQAAAPPQQIEQRLASPVAINSPHINTVFPATANINSPKRPLEDMDDSAQPRKLARGESPALKGAAGRRLDAARRNLAGNSGNTPVVAGPTPLPREINFLLGIIPPAHTYLETRFIPEAMVDMIRNNPKIPLPPNHLPQRYGTTPTTAQQLASIQEKYGGHGGQGYGHGHSGSVGSIGGWGQ